MKWMQVVNPGLFARQSLFLEKEKITVLQKHEQKRVLQAMIYDKYKIQ